MCPKITFSIILNYCDHMVEDKRVQADNATYFVFILAAALLTSRH